MSKDDEGCKGYSQFREITRMVTEFQEPGIAYLMMIKPSRMVWAGT